jgi:hypothetical protein
LNNSLSKYESQNIYLFRNIDKLPTTVSKETIDRLKGFIGLKNEQEIEDGTNFVISLLINLYKVS